MRPAAGARRLLTGTARLVRRYRWVVVAVAAAGALLELLPPR